MHHGPSTNATRNSASLIDFLALEVSRDGADSPPNCVNRVFRGDINKIAVDQVIYCVGGSAGKMIDDGTIIRLGRDRL